MGYTVDETTSSVVQRDKACALLPGSVCVCVWRGAERTGSIPERGGGGRGGEWGQLGDG